MENDRRLYIIAGCNGAGKTTASLAVLPEILGCTEFVNADEIAAGLSPFKPEEVALEAGRLMLKRIAKLLLMGESFAIETTLSTGTYRHLVHKAQALGYTVILLFFWLPTPEMGIMRVAKRVSEGGHNIPADVIRRRYWKGLINLFYVFMPIVDEWMLFDNSDEAALIAHSHKIVNQAKYDQISQICRTKKK